MMAQKTLVCFTAALALASGLAVHKSEKDQAANKFKVDAKLEAKKFEESMMDNFLTVMEEIKETPASPDSDGIQEIETVVGGQVTPLQLQLKQVQKNHPKFQHHALKHSLLDASAETAVASSTKARISGLCMLGRPVLYLASGRFCAQLFQSDLILEGGCSTSLRIPFETVCAPQWLKTAAGAASAAATAGSVATAGPAKLNSLYFQQAR